MNTKRHSFQQGFLPMVVVVVGAVIAGLVIYNAAARLIHRSPATPAAPSTAVSASPNPAPSPASPTAVPADNTKTGSKNCGTNMQCFIAQVATCGPASVEHSLTINFFDAANLTTTSNLSVGKTNSANNCSYTERTDGITETPINRDHAPGGTNPPLNTKTPTTIGSKQVCPSIPAHVLTTLLMKWGNGNLSSEDLAPYHCKFIPSAALAAEMANPTPTSDPFANDNNPHQVYDSLGDGSSITIPKYSLNVSSLTASSITLALKGSDQNAAATTVTLSMNAPQTYFGYVFTLTDMKVIYGNYVGTVTVDPSK